MSNSSGGKGSTIVTVIVVVLILAWIGSCMGSGSTGDKSEKCGVCGRTFTNKDDVSSIVWRNMCENCYSNYKFNQDVKEELKKYDERYGD